MKRPLILFFLLFNISCQSKEIKMEQHNVEIKLNTNFSARFRGEYFDSKAKQNYYFYADPITYKCAKIFDTNFYVIDTIPLTNIPYSDHIKTIQILGNDTIFVSVGDPILFIYLLNFEGKIIKTINTSDWAAKYSNKFSIATPLFQNKAYENFKFYTKYYLKRDDNKYYYTPDFNYILKIDSMVMNSPFLASFTIDSESLVITTHLDNIYKENYNYGYYIDEMPEFYLFNNKAIIPIFHVGKIYVYDLNKNLIEKQFKITSRYTKIGFKSKKKEKNNIGEMSAEQVLYKFHYAGKLQSLIWDRYQNVYYFIIRHQTKEERKFKTFSIIVFDDKFNFKGETKFDDYNKYKFSDLKVTSKGLLINSNNLNHENYEKGIEKYTLFTIVN